MWLHPCRRHCNPGPATIGVRAFFPDSLPCFAQSGSRPISIRRDAAKHAMHAHAPGTYQGRRPRGGSPLSLVRKRCARRGAGPAFTLSCRAEADTIRIEVADTGIGMMPEEATPIGKPFVQTEEGRRAIQGTGLGLAISRSLADSWEVPCPPRPARVRAAPSASPSQGPDYLPTSVRRPLRATSMLLKTGMPAFWKLAR